jgi:hypothetical protein
LVEEFQLRDITAGRIEGLVTERVKPVVIATGGVDNADTGTDLLG